MNNKPSKRLKKALKKATEYLELSDPGIDTKLSSYENSLLKKHYPAFHNLLTSRWWEAYNSRERQRRLISRVINNEELMKQVVKNHPETLDILKTKLNQMLYNNEAKNAK